MSPVLGGTGGANTQTGLRFEEDTDLYQALKATHRFAFYDIPCPGNPKQRCGMQLWENGRHIASLARKKEFARFIAAQYDIDMHNKLSWPFEPDDGLVLLTNPKRVFIIETKFQQGAGSVDEKPANCAFRQDRWDHLFKDTPLGGARTQLIYILSSWFTQKKYEDMIAYVRAQGCLVFINEAVPLSTFGL